MKKSALLAMIQLQGDRIEHLERRVRLLQADLSYLRVAVTPLPAACSPFPPLHAGDFPLDLPVTVCQNAT
jgi:hypothetical protein